MTDIKEKLLKNRFVAFFAADKKRAVAIVAAVIGIMLILLSSVGSAERGASESDYGAEALESEVEEMLSSIRGVGKCRVKISFVTGERLEYKSGEIVCREPPRVLGVSVVCEGGDTAEVRRAVYDAIEALFDIGSNRISVQKLK